MGEELSVNVFEGLLIDDTTRAFLSRQRHSMKKSGAAGHNRNVFLSVSITDALINKLLQQFYSMGHQLASQTVILINFLISFLLNDSSLLHL